MKKRLLLLIASLGIISSNPMAASTNNIVLYSTGFEVSEGYDPQFELAGQNGWVGYGSGGNGVVSNFFEGLGQQGFVGYAPPTDTNGSLSVWHPNPEVNTQYNQIRFSVLMAVYDSSNRQYDDFRWSVYNTNEHRLFSIAFDNSALVVSFALDDTNGFISTGWAFTNSTIYELTLDMNFASNRWSAAIDGAPIIAGQPITKTGGALNFGDVDAVWSVFTPGSPGDNFMVFDNYKIVALASTPPQVTRPRFATIQKAANNLFLLRLSGEPGKTCLVEHSAEMIIWKPLKSGVFPPDGLLDMVDDTTAADAARFYRVKYASP